MFESAKELVEHLRELHRLREAGKAAHKLSGIRRRALRAIDRAHIIAKTGGRCHICGGRIDDAAWQADHILAHSGGGTHAVDNSLPAHALCNNYRWDYSAEEFQLILKIGVWARTHMEMETPIGRKCTEGFVAHERNRIKRRRLGSDPASSLATDIRQPDMGGCNPSQSTS